MIVADPLQHDAKARTLLAEFAEIARRMMSEPREGYDPWLYKYFENLHTPEEVERYVRFHLDNIAFHGCDPRGRDVLDAGCGFGLGLVLHGLLGAESLRGIDIFDGMLATIEAYRPLLPDHVSSRLQVTRASVADIPHPDDSFDLVLSFEAISHYMDVGSFLREAYRVLRPGGTLAVSDGNNGRNWLARRDVIRLWEVAENGPARTMVGGHYVDEPMIDKRRRVIVEQRPELPAGDVARLAAHTSGLAGEELAAAIDRFVEHGALPDRRYRRGDLPVNPIKSEVVERQIDPYALARQLKALGFDVTVHGYWGGANGRRTVRLVNKALSSIDPLMSFTARGFRLAAVKRG